MKPGAKPLTILETLEPDLRNVYTYWEGLKRGENDIPFWDDLKFSLRPQLARAGMLIRVFGTPPRFRFDIVGDDVARLYGKPFTATFSDEIQLRTPLDDFSTQCRATIDNRAPACYRSLEIPGEAAKYSRLVLPLWGNGRIEILLAVVAPL